jgi:hypothetical protein
VATDLTQVSFRSVNGAPITEIAESTLKAGGSMVDTWTRLEPLVQQLISRLSDTVDDAAHLDTNEAATLLGLCATVVQKVGNAAQGVLKASEGLSKLSVLLAAGRGTRKPPSEMSQRQLAAVLVETLKKLGTEGPCPVCHATPAIDII